jgi:hypothetical protein
MLFGMQWHDIILGTLIVLVGPGETVSVWSQDRQPSQRNFDYWQPDWMVRELWGPGDGVSLLG